LESGISGSSELFLIDQHAANEKYLFEEYYRKIKLDYQRLIIPIKIRAPPWIEEVVVEHKDILAKNGFLADIGNDTDGNRCILLNSLPTLSGIGFNRSAALTVKDFMEMTEALNDGDVVLSQSKSDTDPLCLLKLLSCVRSHLASKACRTAIMVGDPLTPAKMTEIVHALSSLDQPWNCPHGRPTMKHLLSLEDLNMLN
jgi:DNA mismatch repair protein PMS2